MSAWLGPLLLVAIGCVACAGYDREHQAALEAAFPPGKITRAQVDARMKSGDPAGSPPRTVARPGTGWTDVRALECERRRGRRVASAEYWMNACGSLVSMTLCRSQFYYDDAGVLACVSEWQSD
jgi:hypothetical protein